MNAPLPTAGSQSVPCPSCGHAYSAVRDARLSSPRFRRRRQCCACGVRYTTFEALAVVGLGQTELEAMAVGAEAVQEGVGALAKRLRAAAQPPEEPQ